MTSVSKDEIAARKAVADSLKTLVAYSAKHVDSTIADYVKKSTTSTVQFSKNTIKSIQAESQKRVDVYTKLMNDYFLKERYTDFAVKSLCEEDAIRQVAILLVAYVKYCDLLGGASIYAEPSDEDEDEEERKKQKAALSSEDRAKCVLSRTMCEEGRLLTGLLAAMLFVNSKISAVHQSAIRHATAAAAANSANSKSNRDAKRKSLSTGGDDDEGDQLFATVTLDYSQKSIASATAGQIVRALPNADSLIGLLSCTSDPHTQLGTLRVIGALAEYDPIVAIPFIASVENGVSAIGQFVGKARVSDHCGSHSNTMTSIQSAAVNALCMLTDPVAIDAAQKADAAAFDSSSSLAAGIDPQTNLNTASAWHGMTGTLQKIIQAALAFDGTLENLLALAKENGGAFAKDDIAAEIEETVAKTVFAVPMDSSAGSPSPHPSVARGEGNLTLVRKAATVISNILKGNHQTTAAFIQMGYLMHVHGFFNVPPPFALQCGDDDLAPLPPFARNKGARATAQVPTLGIELLLQTACDIILQCLSTGAHDQKRLEASEQDAAVSASLSTSQTEAGASGQRNGGVPPPSPQSTGRQTAMNAQKCLDQIIHQSSIASSILHYLSLIGSVRNRGEMLVLTAGGASVFRQLVAILQRLVTLLPGQGRGCAEWIFRNDTVATSTPISQEHSTAYYASSLPHGKTAVGAIVEDLCLRAPQPRTDTSAIVLLTALIGAGPRLGGGGGSFVEVITASIAQCVTQPNATPQPVGIRALACALLPHIGRSSASTGTTLNFMAFIGERFLGQLLDSPEAQGTPSMTTYGDTLLNPSSAAATTLFCLSLIEAIARLEGTDGGCGLTADELNQAETALLTKGTELAKKTFAPSSTTFAIERLMSWVLLASLSHHNFSTHVESRIYKSVRDLLRTSTVRSRTGSTASLDSPLLPEEEQETLTALIDLLFGVTLRKLLQSPDRGTIEKAAQQCTEVLNEYFKDSAARQSSGSPLPTSNIPFPFNGLMLSDKSPFGAAFRALFGICSTPGGLGRRGSGTQNLLLMGGASARTGGGGSVAGGSVATLNSATGGFGFLGDSSSSTFNIMRDVVFRFIQMQSHSGDDDDKSVRSEIELASQKVRNASLSDQLAVKEKQHYEADSKLKALAELSAALLTKRRRRIELLFPKFEDDNYPIAGDGKALAAAGSGWF